MIAPARTSARTGQARIGTSGWAYPHWRARWYPPRLPVRSWLPFHAAHFDTVELNNPFYRLPDAPVFTAWRRAVPPGFVFAVKASRYLTHMRKLDHPAEPLRRLLTRARRLGETLGPVLFQLPGNLRVDVPRLDRFLSALDRQRWVPRLRAVLEVRHPSWLCPAVLRRLHEANVALCLADWRDCPVTDEVTADFVYVRRHGWGRRYGGLYPPSRIAADAADVARWRRRGLDVFVYFNNDGEGAAVGNALRLRALTLSAPRAAGTRPAPCSVPSEQARPAGAAAIPGRRGSSRGRAPR
jgi:uncharacterized protein YecE (DUF72 family)